MFKHPYIYNILTILKNFIHCGNPRPSRKGLAYDSPGDLGPRWIWWAGRPMSKGQHWWYKDENSGNKLISVFCWTSRLHDFIHLQGISASISRCLIKRNQVKEALDVMVGATHIKGYEIYVDTEGGEKHGLHISEAGCSA